MYIAVQLVNTVPSIYCSKYILCARRVIAIYSRLCSLKFAYVSSGSHDLAGQAFLFLSGFLFSFFSPPISPGFFSYSLFLFTFMTKNRKRKACEGGYDQRVLTTDVNVVCIVQATGTMNILVCIACAAVCIPLDKSNTPYTLNPWYNYYMYPTNLTHWNREFVDSHLSVLAKYIDRLQR